LIPSACLRVFQSLDAFERDEQLHWERYLVERPVDAAPLVRYADRQTAEGLGLLVPVGGEHAEFRVVGGRTFVSPARIRMRVLAAMLAFREAEPFDLWDRFVSKKDAKRASRELARHRRRDPQAVAFAHLSPWHVPIRWFTLFKDDERLLGPDGDGRIRLAYRTTTRRAMRRAEWAIPVLRRSDLGPIGELLVELYRWMAAFDPQSLLELDYGGLCDFMTWDELDDDHSARDVQEALEVLGKHEYAAAAEIYQGVLSRWAEVRGHESLN
jgi:hypothetical protein